jgi:hypothetical protein
LLEDELFSNPNNNLNNNNHNMLGSKILGGESEDMKHGSQNLDEM